MPGAAESISVGFIIQIGICIMGLWAFLKVLEEIVVKINKRHDREQKWDEYAKNLDAERDKIYLKYDNKLMELERKIDVNEELAKHERENIRAEYKERLQEIDNKIDYNACQNDAKMQELKVEILIITKALAAVLDGLIEKGCDGPVKEAKKELGDYLITRL